jgi:transcriptional regulator with XRE-family HTH domain
MKKIYGARLEDEREKLGLKKGEMAAYGGVAGSAYTNYSEGKRAPDADFLAAIAAIGADVQYILTGVRSSLVAESSPGYAVLNPREAALRMD